MWDYTGVLSGPKIHNTPLQRATGRVPVAYSLDGKSPPPVLVEYRFSDCISVSITGNTLITLIITLFPIKGLQLHLAVFVK